MPLLSNFLSSEWLNRFTNEINPPIYSVEDLFEKDSIDLVRLLKCPLEQIETIKREIAWKLLQDSVPLSSTPIPSWKSFAPAIPPMNIQSSQSSSFRPTGFNELDEILPSGYPAGQIICLLGASQSGKTQILMTNLVAAAMRGYCSIFIDTCNHFSVKRLALITQQLLLQEQLQNPHMAPPTTEYQKTRAAEILAKISIYRCYDLFSLLDICTKLQSLDFSCDLIAIDCLHQVLVPFQEEGSSVRIKAALLSTISPLISQLGLLWKALIVKHQSTILVSNVLQIEGTKVNDTRDVLELERVGIIPLLGIYDIVIKLAASSTINNSARTIIDAEAIHRPPYWKHLPEKATLVIT